MTKCPACDAAITPNDLACPSCGITLNPGASSGASANSPFSFLMMIAGIVGAVGIVGFVFVGLLFGVRTAVVSTPPVAATHSVMMSPGVSASGMSTSTVFSPLQRGPLAPALGTQGVTIEIECPPDTSGEYATRTITGSGGETGTASAEWTDTGGSKVRLDVELSGLALKVNGTSYGTVSVGDRVLVKTDKVEVNGTERSPAAP